MNIFLPYENFADCAKVLDDKRLTKQILECKQILNMIERQKSDSNYKNPYLHHPVVKHYSNQIHHIVEYALAMCREFRYRFGKPHTYHSYFAFRMTIKLNEFVPLYASGSKHSANCIRETNAEKVYELFKSKLNDKWNFDSSTKWTNRQIPDFYLKEIHNEKL